MFSRAADRQRRSPGVASASRPRSKISAASSALSTVDSALGDKRKYGTVDDAVVGKQPVAIAERGRRGGIDRHADRRQRTAATPRNHCAGRVPPRRTRRHPQRDALRHRRLRTVEKPTPQPSALSNRVSAGAAHTTAPTARTAGQSTSDAIDTGSPSQPRWRHQASQASAHRRRSGAGSGGPSCGSWAAGCRADGLGTAAQNLVVASPTAFEERLGVLPVDHRGESRPWPQWRAGPLPHVAEHLFGAIRSTPRPGRRRPGRAQRVAAGLACRAVGF